MAKTVVEQDKMPIKIRQRAKAPFPKKVFGFSSFFGLGGFMFTAPGIGGGGGTGLEKPLFTLISTGLGIDAGTGAGIGAGAAVCTGSDAGAATGTVTGTGAGAGTASSAAIGEICVAASSIAVSLGAVSSLLSFNPQKGQNKELCPVSFPQLLQIIPIVPFCF